MDDELARELQQATTELLDLTSVRGTRAAVTPATAPPAPTVSIPVQARVFSPDSKLEPIYSPTDIRPSPISRPLIPPEPEDNLPKAGLSSTVGSVRPIIHLHGELDDDDDHVDAQQRQPQPQPQPPPPSETQSKLRIRTPVNDVYLNEYGERIVNGKVVGRMSVGRRRDTDKQTQSHSHTHGHSHSHSHQTQPDENRTHTQTPPAFFLQSFPDALEPRQPSAEEQEQEQDTQRILQAPRPMARALRLATDDDDDEPSFHTADIGQRPKLELPFPSRRPTPTTQVTSAQTAPLRLHGNRRQAQQADPTSGSAPASLPIPPHTPDSHDSLGKRIERLFTTPLVPPSDDHGQDQDQPWDRSGRSLSVPSSPTQPYSPNASLDSLPASLTSLPVSATSSQKGMRHLSDSAFARQVRIRGFTEVGARGWVVYEIHILPQRGTTISIFRRFRSFIALRDNLAAEFPSCASKLPRLPSRSTGLLHKYSARHLEGRRKALQSWLETVAMHPEWGSANALRDWVLNDE